MAFLLSKRLRGTPGPGRHGWAASGRLRVPGDPGIATNGAFLLRTEQEDATNVAICYSSSNGLHPTSNGLQPTLRASRFCYVMLCYVRCLALPVALSGWRPLKYTASTWPVPEDFHHPCALYSLCSVCSHSLCVMLWLCHIQLGTESWRGLNLFAGLRRSLKLTFSEILRPPHLALRCL